MIRRRHALTLAWVGLAAPLAAQTPPAALSVTPLEVNQAQLADLESFAGIGPALAQRMLQARAAAEFKSWADMMGRVSGMGPRLADKLSAQGLRVNGQPYRTPAQADPPS